MYYCLVIIPMTMKLCHRDMPTKTFNIHEFVNNNKQPQALKTFKLMFMAITWLC